MKDIKENPKFKSTHKLPAMVDTNITPSNPISGTMTQEYILTREQLAKMD